MKSILHTGDRDGEEKFSAASLLERLLEVLAANLDCGARVILEAIGPDEQEAINELEASLLRFRDEEGVGSGKIQAYKDLICIVSVMSESSPLAHA